MLGGILAPDWERLTLAQSADALYDWETTFEKYRAQSGEQVGETMRVAIVLGRVLRLVRDTLRAQLRAIDNDWVKFKSVLHQVLISDRVYSMTGGVAGGGGGGRRGEGG